MQCRLSVPMLTANPVGSGTRRFRLYPFWRGTLRFWPRNQLMSGFSRRIAVNLPTFTVTAAKETCLNAELRRYAGMVRMRRRVQHFACCRFTLSE